jgi:hypothetical protein
MIKGLRTSYGQLSRADIQLGSFGVGMPSTRVSYSMFHPSRMPSSNALIFKNFSHMIIDSRHFVYVNPRQTKRFQEGGTRGHQRYIHGTNARRLIA